jgi:hypothetical protein
MQSSGIYADLADLDPAFADVTDLREALLHL